jgi:error-prone DNA polymerase
VDRPHPGLSAAVAQRRRPRARANDVRASRVQRKLSACCRRELILCSVLGPMFSELLGRSSFYFIRGASHPEQMVERAKELGLDALALCDRNGLYGSVRAHTASVQLEQRVIVGAELTVAPRDARWRRRGATAPASAAGADEAPSVALLVTDHHGYENLCRLLTRSHAELPKDESALELSFLAEHHRGLVAVVPAPRVPGGPDEPPPELLASVRDVFGDRGFVAAHRHLDPWDRARLEAVEGWSRRYGLEVVASARPFMHHRARKPLLDVLYCIRNGTTLDGAGTALGDNAEAYLRSELQMQRLFRDRPAWVERAGEVGQALRFRLDELHYRFPCELAPGETADEKLRRLTWQGAARRYPGGVPEGVCAQLQKELNLIKRIEVAPYFLCTWEIVEIARRRRILCQGRGSAANSAVCYVLGITAVDPARSSLLFERFMSVERREPPDIDIDFEHERREEVIQELYERYGRERAAMVSEVICYRGKSALREVGKVFGLSLEQVDRLSGTITHWDAADVRDERIEEMGFDMGDGRVRQVVMLARAIQGFPRHLSIHVGGFVLSADPLFQVAPIEPARMPDRTVVPWDKDDLEELGFFKVDVLGLGMLTAVRKALALMHAGGGLRQNDHGASDGEGEEFDPLEVVTRIPPEDPAVYEMIGHADTVGVFQIESRAQMAMLPRLRPKRFYDLVIEVAIVRPGPIQGGMVHPYLRRRNGEEAVTLPHPDLEAILERTLGVPLFQEQVMQIAIEGAGYSGGEADQLRRDMAAWRRNGKLMRHRQRLLDGFSKKGIAQEFGEALFQQIKGFGDYGFPESHAASFALIVYASAWIKARYPAHFACALINSQPMGFYTPSTILQDAQRHGVEVRDVDITRSDWDCTLEETETKERPRLALRLGLRLVKGFGGKTAQRIEVARAESPFASIEDLTRRARLKKDDVEALAEAGALEPVVSGRRHALWRARAPRVEGLFNKLDVREPIVTLPPLRPQEQLVLDYGRKGLSVEDHPMRHLRKAMQRRRVLTARQLLGTHQDQNVSVAGLVICRQQPGTASGVVFVTLEDETGFSNLVLWRRIYEQFHHIARHATLLLAHGKIERQGEVIHVIAESLERLDVPGQKVRSLSRDFH